MRHTTATLMLNNGADLVTVQHILGHENPSTTQIYAKASDTRIEYEYRRHLIQ
jgi:integrase/recombinase XerD